VSLIPLNTSDARSIIAFSAVPAAFVFIGSFRPASRPLARTAT
jgi:hypothetical protein